MTTLNILISDSIQDFVNEQSVKGGYSSASEYIKHLIFQEVERVQQARLETLLLEGLDSGESIEITDEWWEQKRMNIR